MDAVFGAKVAVGDAIIGKEDVTGLDHNPGLKGIEGLSIGQGTSQLAARTKGASAGVDLDISLFHRKCYNMAGSIGQPLIARSVKKCDQRRRNPLPYWVHGSAMIL